MGERGKGMYVSGGWGYVCRKGSVSIHPDTHVGYQVSKFK